MKRDLIDISNLAWVGISDLLLKAAEIKWNLRDYTDALKNKTLMMIFEKPSLRTRVSFEVGMTQLGGHAIYYDLATSPMGKKESVSDTAKTSSRYVDVIMARLFSHDQIKELAESASVPVINALTDVSHPCQILADLMTIKEKKGKLKGLTVCYLGDGNNNVTTSLIEACAIMEINLRVCCPVKKGYQPDIKTTRMYARHAEWATLAILSDPKTAITGADVVYTDSWMSYHILEKEKKQRIKDLKPYQVTAKLMSYAKQDAIFMHCLPATRGMEVTTDVIDGPQSVVFDQAENRLHMQKAILLWVMGR